MTGIMPHGPNGGGPALQLMEHGEPDTSADFQPSPFTDLKNAERFAEQHKQSVRYCHAWKCWLIWTGARWERDESGAVVRLAKATARSIYQEAARAASRKAAEGLAGWASASETKKRLDSMLALAQSEPGIAVAPADLDRDAWVLNLQSGTLDLRTGEHRNHRREDLITRLAPVQFDPEARCPLWDSFLLRAVPDEGSRLFLRRASGYSCTGSTQEQCLFFLFGPGGGGKTTYTTTMERFLGDYATRINAGILMHRDWGGGETNSPERAEMFGRRWVTASEIQQGQRLDEALVKDLSGGDRIRACRKYEHPFEWEPTHSLWMYGNYRPVIRGTDSGIWRRIRLVRFPEQIPNPDPALPDKLAAEFPGILNWVLAGLSDWHEQGGRLGLCPAVDEATKEYKESMDVIGRFIDERCTRGNTEENATALFQRFKGWAEETGEPAFSQRVFGESLAERGFEKIRRATGYVWRGIGM